MKDQIFSERFDSNPIPFHNPDLLRPHELFKEFVRILDKAVEKHNGSEEVKQAAELAYRHLQRQEALVAHVIVGGKS